MKPFFNSGFGSFSRVLGPWTDFFPSSAGFGLDSSQFGVCLGTKIQGGDDGATITKVIVDSPFNIAGSQAACNWRFIVVKGDLAPEALQALDNDFQLATNGWPRKGGSDLRLPLLFDKVFGNQRVVNGYASASTDAPELDLGDESPASVSSGEIMTALLVPLFNATGVPGYGANNSTFINLSVIGKYARSAAIRAGAKDTNARSYPRGRISGI